MPKRNLSAVITLFFIAPLVAEYLLGDLPLKLLSVILVLAPMYGGGAVLIREVARRKRRGWPTMLLLGMAYMLIEEGLVTQSLFNHDYLKLHLHLLDPAYIPALGIGAWWTLFMINLHAFWSMGVSIALVEALYAAEAKTPWLGSGGAAMVAVLFVLGSAANFGIGFKQNHFVASHAQLLSVAALCITLLVLVMLLPGVDWRVRAGSLPSPWLTGAATFALGLAVMSTPPRWGWGAFWVMLGLDAVFLAFVAWLSRRSRWSALHILSLAAGGALTYGIHAFMQGGIVPGGLLWIQINHVVFLAAAVILIALGVKHVSRLTARGAGATLEI